MDIIYLGHSSFKISDRRASVVTDPYDKESVGLKFPKTQGTIVTLSHDHSDHNKSDAVEDVKKVISGPGEYEIEGISIMGFSSFHDDKNGELRGKNTIYVFEFEGFRIAHMGDLGHKLKEQAVTNLGELDVMMIPVGGEYTIGPEEAAEVCRTIEPKIIIPMHYKVDGLKEDLASKLKGVDEFVKELGLNVEKSNKLSMKEGSILPDDSKILILEKK